MAHKLEQASDMDSGAIVAVTVQTMDGGDCASMPNTLEEAERQLGGVDAQAREVVADKGYHSNATMKRLKAQGLRSYVSEPQRGRRNWKRDRAAQQPTYDNRRRVRGARGKRLLRRRGEKLERAFAHLLQTGGLRRVPVRGQENIRKRLLVHAAAFNLGLLMRHRHGVGTPRSLQGRAAAVYLFPISRPGAPCTPPIVDFRPLAASETNFAAAHRIPTPAPRNNQNPIRSHFCHGLLACRQFPAQ